MSYLMTSNILPFVIILALFWWLMSRMGGAGGMLGMGGKKNSGKRLEGQTPTTKFADVAGEDEAVAEVEEIKDFLATVQVQGAGCASRAACCCTALPARVRRCWPEPSQVRPACRSKPMAGSDFVEMFVGLGASRVRDLFDEARDAPAIILHR